MKKPKISSYHIVLTSGTLSSFGDSLPFLSEKQLEEFNSIGSSGKTLKGEKMTFESYLNEEFPEEAFSVMQTQFDNGEFIEKFTVTRVYNP